MNASVRQGFAAPAKFLLELAQAQEKIMQLQDMLSRISVRHKSTERVSSWRGTGQHCSVFLRHVFWQGIQQRQDSSSRRTWLRCKGHVA